MNKDRLVFAAKEFGRIVFLALPSFLIALLVQYMSTSPELSTGVFGLILAILKSYDRGLHEDKSTNINGIAPF